MNTGKKILLIEDEMFIRDLYFRVLSKAGFNVIAAQDGAEGLTKVFENPDLILLDIMLPKMNGIELLKKFKNDDLVKHIPVVLLTNLGQESVILEALDIGAQGYLMKMRHDPYEIVDLVGKFINNPGFKMEVEQMDLDK